MITRFDLMEKLWDQPPSDGEAGVLALDVARIEVIHFTTHVRVEIRLENEEKALTYQFVSTPYSTDSSNQLVVLARAVYLALGHQLHTSLRPYLCGYPGWIWQRTGPDGFQQSR